MTTSPPPTPSDDNPPMITLPGPEGLRRWFAAQGCQCHEPKLIVDDDDQPIAQVHHPVCPVTTRQRLAMMGCDCDPVVAYGKSSQHVETLHHDGCAAGAPSDA